MKREEDSSPTSLPPHFIAVIPARYASTRLPGKALADIAGKPMIVHVAEQAQKSGANEVWVATDDARIVDAVAAAGFRACLTRGDHASGTDRVAEWIATENIADDTIVVNVQGDEPLIDPALIGSVAQSLAAHPEATIATACHPLGDPASLFDPNVVKVALDRESYALYFSRAPIPYARDAFAADRDALPADLPVFRHIGIYAYRARFVREYATLAAPSIERHEALEQLRALWYGHRIIVVQSAGAPAPSVDTEEDLRIVRALFNRNR